MQRALEALFGRMGKYSQEYLRTGVFDSMTPSCVAKGENLVTNLAVKADHVISLVEMFVLDFGGLGDRFNTFMDRHGNSIRELVYRSVHLVQLAPIWPGMYAWSEFHSNVIKLLEWYHNCNSRTNSHFDNNQWALWLARMLAAPKLEYDVRVRLAKALSRYLRGKSRTQIREELGVPDMQSLVRLNHVVCKHVASRPREVDATLSEYTREIVGLFGVVD